MGRFEGTGDNGLDGLMGCRSGGLSVLEYEARTKTCTKEALECLQESDEFKEWEAAKAKKSKDLKIKIAIGGLAAYALLMTVLVVTGPLITGQAQPLNADEGPLGALRTMFSSAFMGDKEVGVLQEQLSKAEARYKAAEAEKSRQIATVKALQASAQQASQRDSALASKEKALASALAAKESLTAKLESANMDKAELNSQVKSLTSLKASLTSEKNSLASKLASTTSQLEVAKAKAGKSRKWYSIFSSDAKLSDIEQPGLADGAVTAISVIFAILLYTRHAAVSRRLRMKSAQLEALVSKSENELEAVAKELEAAKQEAALAGSPGTPGRRGFLGLGRSPRRQRNGERTPRGDVASPSPLGKSPYDDGYSS